METKVTKKARVSNIPNAEADFINVARSVAAKWKTTPKISLMWTSTAKFKATVDAFEASFSARANAKGQRSIVTAKHQQSILSIRKSKIHFQLSIFN